MYFLGTQGNILAVHWAARDEGRDARGAVRAACPRVRATTHLLRISKSAQGGQRGQTCRLSATLRTLCTAHCGFREGQDKPEGRRHPRSKAELKRHARGVAEAWPPCLSHYAIHRPARHACGHTSRASPRCALCGAVRGHSAGPRPGSSRASRQIHAVLLVGARCWHCRPTNSIPFSSIGSARRGATQGRIRDALFSASGRSCRPAHKP